MLEQIWNTINQIPSEAWDILIEILVSAIIVSPLALGLKKWWKIDGEKVMLGLVILASLLASVIIYLQSDPRFAPWIVAVQGGLTFATTQPVYYLFVKPLFTRLSLWFSSQVDQAVALNDVKSAALPSDGLPIGNKELYGKSGDEISPKG